MAFIKNIATAATDSELVLQYRNTGNLNVLGTLYNRYMDPVYGVCLKYLQDPDEAKDSVMLIFEELVTKLKKYEVSNFRGWLWQLARNHCLMKIRSDKKRPVNVDTDLVYLADNWHPDNELQKEALMNDMEYCLEQLPGEQQKAVRLFYLEEKCYKEIAETTGAELKKVRSFIQNGRRNLKICMEGQAGKQQTL
ncbi:MAG: sigma-70 family RNA polymerase sigma factor [Ferruginibacter sp.]